MDKIKGVGEKTAKLFTKIGAPTAGDLLRLYPRNYEDWSNVVEINEAVPDDVNVIKATVLMPLRVTRAAGGMNIYKTDVTDGISDMRITFFYRPPNNRMAYSNYTPFVLNEGETYYFRGKVNRSFSTVEMNSPVYVTEAKYREMVSVYPLTSGLKINTVRNAVRDCLAMLPDPMADPIPAEIRQKYELCTLDYALNNIHFPLDSEALAIASRRLIFEELLVLQLGLRRIRQRVKAENTHRFEKDYTDEFTELLPFELTNAQKRAIAESVADMMSDNPMNRLVQGDVGSGKTAVAAALCYNAIRNKYQAAMMAPTEILANQHYESLKKLLEPCMINVVLLTGSVKGKAKKLALEQIKNGDAQLIVGTHALISDGVEYANLGLVITDEQHRFGVNQRSALAGKADNPHTLVMSATPIPRTLALMIYGDLDISIINELPPGRQKIRTVWRRTESRRDIYNFISAQIAEGRQAFIICPLIDESESDMASVNEYAEMLRSYFPEEYIGVVHGKMKAAEKDAVMDDFSANKLKILVSTTVVEVGVDVPNSTIMMIENAERYGLSQIHQLRGRVGRGKHQSYCILISDAQNQEAVTRMKTMCAHSNGFEIAEIDLKLRGPGDFFGERQHGLPQLKIADMLGNMDTMKEAQEAANKILSEDPYLESNKYKGLKAETKQLFDKSGGITF
ncbi:MAG: ATP-dependent DNA helicase RecG [Clostridia bacterium]|nr:ATP-dependent DNA helicase RecG [Clostridia bacterium]